MREDAATITAAKRLARAEAKQRGAALSPAEWQVLGYEMADFLFTLPQWQAAKTLFCFASMPNEPCTLLILRRALDEGKQLLVPRVVPGVAGQMELVRLDDLADLQPHGPYRIPEPVRGAVVPVETLGAEALALIPCVAAGKDGARLGHGGGYYDRFLAHYKGAKLLVCPTALLFDTLPADRFDVVFEKKEILTEKGIFV